jgi:hypothetical protein
MDDPAVSALLRPVETVVDGHPACHWPMQEYPPEPVRASLWFLAVQEEAHDWGFHKAVSVNDGLTRRIELLGPDSPGEYVYAFDRRLVDRRFMQTLTIDLLWWIRQRGMTREVLTNGQ